ncbi:MAG TPA: oligosaccharide flippase family protein [Flavobacterium sp.]|uniref:lipopolysaccharide biosynthesis protein n=1 Tax=Flavobacterium sp. TaxID=239 RepID=UPI002D165D7E|nr:oligosaccharide flippase family protein [Flavobacterium sp.]HSD14713.1 oligosaccharide flippase family protein [Flavobacterium sp.]
MSVVARQSLKYSIVGYFSTLIGILSTVFLYPHDLDFAGKLQFVFQTAMLALPVVALGIMHANVRFFPKMVAENNQQNLFKFSVGFILANFSIGLILLFLAVLIFPQLKTTDFWEMSVYILPVALLLAIIQLCSKYISIKKRIVVPNIFENVFPKIGMVAAFLFFFLHYLSEEDSIWLFVGVFVLALLGMLLYLNRLEKLSPKIDFSFLRQDGFQRELMAYSFFTFLGSMGSVVALNIDTYMIGEMLTFKEITIYNTSLNLVRMITVPALGVYTISAPIIAGYIAENNMQDLKALHHKTSLYLFAIGAVLFGLVAVGIEDLFMLMKNGDQLAKGLPVVYIMGFAFLFDLATGFNGYIISNSKYYKFNNTTTVALAVLTITTNLIFLFWFKMGIVGVSLATAISLTVYNAVKIVFNYRKFGVHPFSNKYLYLLGLLTVVLVVGQLLPDFGNKFLTLCYKPGVAFVIFALGNQIFKIIPVKEVMPKSLFGKK